MISKSSSTLIFLLAAFLPLKGFSDSPKRYYVVPTEYLKEARLATTPNLLSQWQGLQLVELNRDSVLELSIAMHEQKHVCGGFVDVTDDISPSNRASLLNVLKEHHYTPQNIAAFDKKNLTHPQAVGKALQSVDKTRFWNFLGALTSQQNRCSYMLSGQRAAEGLQKNAQDIALKYGRTDVETRMVDTGADYPQKSVVVRIPGANSTLPAPLIGGHMDTYPGARPGADDDGTGTATVMEIFEGILQSGLTFERDLYFVFYAAEEMGLVGSGRVVKDFKAKQIPIRGVVQFDMTGLKSIRDTQEIYFHTDFVDFSLNDFLEKITVEYLGISRIAIGTTECGYACSDHASWHRNGVSAAFPFETSMDNYNKRLHTEDDKMGYLSPDHAFKFVRLGIAFMVEAGEAL